MTTLPRPHKKYTMSPKGVIQRSIATTKHGFMSVAQKEIGKCKNCPIVGICERSAIDKEQLVRRIGEDGKNRIIGCNQAFTLFQHHARNLMKPELFLMNEIAYIKTKTQMQESIDTKDKTAISAEYLKAMDLLGKFLKLFMENQKKRPAPVSIHAETVQFNAPNSPVEKTEEELIDEERKKVEDEGGMLLVPPTEKEKVDKERYKERNRMLSESMTKHHKENREKAFAEDEEVEEKKEVPTEEGVRVL